MPDEIYRQIQGAVLFMVLPVGVLALAILYVMTEHRKEMASIQKQQISGDEVIRLNAMNRLIAVPYKDSTVYLVIGQSGSTLVLARSKGGGYQLLGTPEEVSRTFREYRGFDKYLEDEEIRQQIADLTLEGTPRLGDRRQQA